jgi:5'-methylthioadenosine phosphorylase
VQANAANAKRVLAEVIPKIPESPGWPEHAALENALMTDRSLWPEATVQNLRPLLDRFL